MKRNNNITSIVEHSPIVYKLVSGIFHFHFLSQKCCQRVGHIFEYSLWKRISWLFRTFFFYSIGWCFWRLFCVAQKLYIWQLLIHKCNLLHFRTMCVYSVVIIEHFNMGFKRLICSNWNILRDIFTTSTDSLFWNTSFLNIKLRINMNYFWKVNNI